MVASRSQPTRHLNAREPKGLELTLTADFVKLHWRPRWRRQPVGHLHNKRMAADLSELAALTCCPSRRGRRQLVVSLQVAWQLTASLNLDETAAAAETLSRLDFALAPGDSSKEFHPMSLLIGLGRPRRGLRRADSGGATSVRLD